MVLLKFVSILIEVVTFFVRACNLGVNYSMLVLVSWTGVFTTKYKLVLTTFCFSEIFFAIYILLLSQTSQNLSFGMY